MRPVVINSLPKSGTHLVAKTLQLLGYTRSSKANILMAGSILRNDGWKVWARHLVRGHHFGLQPLNIGIDAPVGARVSWVRKMISQTLPGGFLPAHVPYSRQMEELFNEGGLGMIRVTRDPRDVILSWAHYIAKEEAHFAHEVFRTKTLEERIGLVIEGYTTPSGLQVDGIAEVVRRLQGWGNYHESISIRFEELVGSQGGGGDEEQLEAVCRIADFVQVDQAQAKNIVHKIHGGTRTFRKGQIGAWSEELTSSFIEEMNDKIKDVCTCLGY